MSSGKLLPGKLVLDICTMTRHRRSARLEETKAIDDETERLLEAAIAEYKRQIQGAKTPEPSLAGTN